MPDQTVYVFTAHKHRLATELIAVTAYEPTEAEQWALLRDHLDRLIGWGEYDAISLTDRQLRAEDLVRLLDQYAASNFSVAAVPLRTIRPQPLQT